MHKVEGRVDVDVDGEAPATGGVLERLAGRRDGGVIDEDVDAAELVVGLVDGSLDGVLVLQIDADRETALSFSADEIGGLVDRAGKFGW